MTIQSEQVKVTTQTKTDQGKATPLVASILNPVYRRTALVKLQGPFTDVQLDSIARGLVYLEKLGLTSVIVIEHDQIVRGDEGERAELIGETMRAVVALEKRGTKARPVLGSVVRLGPKPGEENASSSEIVPPEAHAMPSDLIPIRSALHAGEIPVLAPFALDSSCCSARIDANDVIAALAQGMVEAAALEKQKEKVENPEDAHVISNDIDLTPMRLVIINREGGVPSYARSGYPHLLINLSSEYEYVHNTFQQSWRQTHPTSLSNLSPV